MENDNAFKHFISLESCQSLAKALAKIDTNFDAKKFLNQLKILESLELKERVRLISQELRNNLASDYTVALGHLLEATQRLDIRGFSLWPITDFIQHYGLDHRDYSYQAMKEITHRFTCEWAIRPFLREFTSEALEFLLECAQADNHHIRRFASEGSRPRLPWGEQLKVFINDPSLTWPILEKLKNDDEQYVRKSVANHLNDLSKDHPKFVLDQLKQWQKKAKGDEQKKIAWIIRHSLRTLIKAGNPAALKLIGINPLVKTKTQDLKIKKKKIKLGESLEFSFSLKNLDSRTSEIVIDYVMHFKKANGQLAAKVFKLKHVRLKKGESITISKKHAIKKITTRVYYPGKQLLEIQVNGKRQIKSEWQLLT